MYFKLLSRKREIQENKIGHEKNRENQPTWIVGKKTVTFCYLTCKMDELERSTTISQSSIFSFRIVERAYGNRNRGDLLTAGEYWEVFFCFFFLLVTYLRFSEVEFLKFYYQDKKKLKKVSLKILYKKKRPQVPLRSSNESMDKHSFQGSSKFTKQAFLYHLTYSFVPWWLLYYFATT